MDFEPFPLLDKGLSFLQDLVEDQGCLGSLVVLAAVAGNLVQVNLLEKVVKTSVFVCFTGGYQAFGFWAKSCGKTLVQMLLTFVDCNDFCVQSIFGRFCQHFGQG